MKNVKVFFGFLLVVMATLFIYACAKEIPDFKKVKNGENLVIENRTEEPCDEAAANCTSTPWSADQITTVSIPLYPGCTFEVKYRYRVCPNGKIDVEIIQYADWLPCAAFNADIIIDSFIISKVEKEIMSEVVDLLVNLPAIYSTIPPCGSGLIVFGFSVSSCVNFCIFSLGPEITELGEIIKVGYSKIPCGEACCRTSYEICIDSNNEVQKYTSVSQGTGNCESQTPNLECPENTIGSTGCIPNCYLL